MADTTTFRESIKKVCPTWLQGTWGYRTMYSIGVQIDAVAEALRQGVLARFPGYGTPEALPAIGADRQIQRGLNESDEAYTERLQQAIPTWHFAGNAASVINQLMGYVSPETPMIRYVTTGSPETYGTVENVADYVTIQAGVVTLQRRSGVDYNWDWDGAPGGYRFWMILYFRPTVVDGEVWGGFNWGASLWGSSGGPNFVQDIKNLILKWKCAGTECTEIIVPESSTDFDPTSPPGYPMPDGDWDVPANRLPTALYWGSVLE